MRCLTNTHTTIVKKMVLQTDFEYEQSFAPLTVFPLIATVLRIV